MGRPPPRENLGREEPARKDGPTTTTEPGAAPGRDGRLAPGGRRGTLLSALAAILALGCGPGRAPIVPPPAPPTSTVDPPPAARVAPLRPESGEGARPVRFFFVADTHSRHHLVERFLEEALLHRPPLIIHGGDFVHDGTESEFRRARADAARLESPWVEARGNHDVQRRGPFAEPPPAIPPLDAWDHEDVRFIVLDNHDETLTEPQFLALEAELEAHAGRRIVVVMHVPPFLSRERGAARLRRLLPFRLASPVMRVPEQVERFAGLVARHRVLAVLTAHAHAPDRLLVDGVHYVVAGAAGGLTPGLGIASEYLDVTVVGRELEVRRVVLEEPPGNAVAFLARAFRFYAELNGFNHRSQGWNYVPSASVQLRGGVERIERRGEATTVAAATVSFERVLGARGWHSFLADGGAAAGPGSLAARLSLGYRVRPVGSFNRNVFVGAGATANAGLLTGSAAAGVGARAGVGLEWRGLTLEASREWGSGHRATAITLGRRY